VIHSQNCSFHPGVEFPVSLLQALTACAQPIDARPLHNSKCSLVLLLGQNEYLEVVWHEQGCMACRGRSRRLTIESLRSAMKDGTLETVLQKDAPIPPDRKMCKLCGQIKALDEFRELPRGGHESYCRPCNRYVRRGVKRGLHIDVVRRAFMVHCNTHGFAFLHVFFGFFA
jgi:hypothetical protein